MRILQVESELQEIVKLVGIDALSSAEQLNLETARSIREDFLQQDAFNEDDAYSPIEKQFALLKLILSFDSKAKAALDKGASIEDIVNLPVREKIGRAKQAPLKTYKEDFVAIEKEMDTELDALKGGDGK